MSFYGWLNFIITTKLFTIMETERICNVGWINQVPHASHLFCSRSACTNKTNRSWVVSRLIACRQSIRHSKFIQKNLLMQKNNLFIAPVQITYIITSCNWRFCVVFFWIWFPRSFEISIQKRSYCESLIPSKEIPISSACFLKQIKLIEEISLLENSSSVMFPVSPRKQLLKKSQRHFLHRQLTQNIIFKIRVIKL